jgi:hypothetical protein
MPENSIPKEAAYQIINDELMLDGNPRLNLASFVTTWMEPECDKLIMAAINKNYVDMDEYPVTTELQVHHPASAVSSLCRPSPVLCSQIGETVLGRRRLADLTTPSGGPPCWHNFLVFLFF